jgi:DNA primase
MIPDDVIEQVRDAADVISIVGESVDLKRTGSDWRGPCPFHGGTHRNFAVIPKKGLFYCYVCHEAGDVFSYFMKRFGMDYPTAVREIARRVGIEIPDRPERGGRDEREPLFSALAVAHDWYTRQLRESSEAAGARDYLVGRDVPLDESAPLGLGYAPRDGRAFLTEMGRLGVDTPTLLAAGLAAERDDGRVVARFRERLLFPIHDLRGRVVGFGGRLLGDGEPKYLNSPESKVFRKGGMLYNLHQAKQPIRREESVILVEGYFDVLRLVLAGIEHVVAPLGTALTSDQAALLARYSPQAILLYDSDAAGLRATFRAGDELLRHSVRVRVATMPEGEDPDTLVRKGGAKAIEPVLRDAMDVLERKVQLLERRGWFGDVEHRREALDRLLPSIRAAADPITRDMYLSLVAEKTGVSRDVLAKEAAALPAGSFSAPQPPSAAPSRLQPPSAAHGAPPRPRRKANAAETALMLVLLGAPDWRERAVAEVDPEWLEYPPFRAIFNAIRTRAPVPESLDEVGQRVWEKLQTRLAEGPALEPDRTYVDACAALEARPLMRRYHRLLHASQLEPDQGRQAELMTEMKTLSNDIRTRYPEEWRRRSLRKPGEERARGY